MPTLKDAYKTRAKKKKKEMYGYNIREPYKSENEYFKANKNVAGMATQDNKIIINPHTNLAPIQQDSVIKNEASRLWLRENEVDPLFEITDEQRKFFTGTPYEKDELAMRHTILSRIHAGDSSIGAITEDQAKWGDWLSNTLQSSFMDVKKKKTLRDTVKASKRGRK